MPRETGTTRQMREESHLDDMRAAIRGDFERLAERRGAQELMSPPLEPAEAADERPPADEPPAWQPPVEPVSEAVAAAPVEPEATTELSPEDDAEPEAAPPSAVESEPADADEDAARPRRSWLARLLGW